MAMLEIRDLNVYYGGIHALKGCLLKRSVFYCYLYHNYFFFERPPPT